MYFSKPRSEAKPVSLTTKSARRRARRCETTELVPWAMLAKGPQWTKAGVPSVVWARLGSMASVSRAIMGPTAPRSAARTGSPVRVLPMTMAERRRRRSSRLSASERMAMISLAAVMTKPEGRLLSSRCFLSGATTPVTTWRRARSFMSRVRGQGDGLGIEVELVAVEEVRVDEGGEQVVGRGDGVEVAVEVEVDLVGGLDLAASAAGGAALHAEDRAERGLARGDEGALADALEALDEADGGDGLALAGGGRAWWR